MRTSYASATQIPAGTWKWEHFSPAEWACKGTGRITVESEFMDKLEELRTACGFPLPINSGFRSPEYNAKVSGTGKRGPHTTARAADIGVHGAQAFVVVREALALGFTGIGLKQHGPVPGMYVHVDMLGDVPTRPAMWTYEK